MLAKAPRLVADALILDLEDGVPLAEKEAARGLLGEWLREGTPQAGGPTLFVRVNAIATGMAEKDLAATLCPGVVGVCLPKVESVGDIEALSRMLEAVEAERQVPVGSTRVIAFIESAKGLIRAHDIASASPRLVALAFGAEDYTFDLGIRRTRQGDELTFPRAQLVVAARAAEVGAIDAIYTDLSDEAGLRREVSLARQMGFAGKQVIHPGQLAIVNAGFLPSDEEIAYAQKLIAAFEAAERAGTGVISLDGKMIDMPVVRKARRIVDSAGQG